MKYLNTQKNSNESGFTILESLIAIFILTTSITGPLVYGASGIKAAREAKFQMIAYYLAAETIEEIKFYRDNNKTNPEWYKLNMPGGHTNVTSDGGFDWNHNTKSFRQCNPGQGGGDSWKCESLLVDGDGRYGYSNGDLSIFKRGVSKYEEAPGSFSHDEYIVTVNVSWDDGVVSGEIDITEHIFNIHNS